jgi:hypothetical protein
VKESHGFLERVIQVDIKEVKTPISKGSAKPEDESSPPGA